MHCLLIDDLKVGDTIYCANPSGKYIQEIKITSLEFKYYDGSAYLKCPMKYIDLQDEFEVNDMFLTDYGLLTENYKGVFTRCFSTQKEVYEYLRYIKHHVKS